jgi:SOS-response transcriptional repressor LexA
MAPLFQESDIVIIDASTAPLPGDTVVAQLDSEKEATIKTYRPRGADEDGAPIIDLVPLNDYWPTLRIDAKTPGRIVGVVTEHRRFRKGGAPDISV